MYHTLTGPVLSRSATRRVGDIPDELFSLKNTESLDGNNYLNTKLHQAYHHYIKVRVCIEREEMKRIMGRVDRNLSS